jgi:hypothetical protein
LQLVGRLADRQGRFVGPRLLDLVGLAYLQIGSDGRAEFPFGAVNATGQLDYAPRMVFFRWTGFDEATKSPAKLRPCSNTTQPRNRALGRQRQPPPCSSRSARVLQQPAAGEGGCGATSATAFSGAVDRRSSECANDAA